MGHRSSFVVKNIYGNLPDWFCEKYNVKYSFSTDASVKTYGEYFKNVIIDLMKVCAESDIEYAGKMFGVAIDDDKNISVYTINKDSVNVNFIELGTGDEDYFLTGGMPPYMRSK